MWLSRLIRPCAGALMFVQNYLRLGRLVHQQHLNQCFLEHLEHLEHQQRLNQCFLEHLERQKNPEILVRPERQQHLSQHFLERPVRLVRQKNPVHPVRLEHQQRLNQFFLEHPEHPVRLYCIMAWFPLFIFSKNPKI